MPNVGSLTVADELAFDALPIETRELCEKIIESRAEDVGFVEDMEGELRDAKDERDEAQRENMRLMQQVRELKDEIAVLRGPRQEGAA